jgi:hypothetical protein
VVKTEATRLKRQVQRFLRGEDPAAQVLTTLAQGRWRTYVFGGTLREIILNTRNREFRDLDIVVNDAGFKEFERALSRQIVGRNSFNGLRLVVCGFKVDAWPLGGTWAFKNGYVGHPSVERLPDTTFLNLDSVVMEITPGRIGRERFYAERFINALERNTMDIVLAENPLPALAAVRAVRLHLKYDIPISRRLGAFILNYLEHNSPAECVEHQRRHYNQVVIDKEAIILLTRNLRQFVTKTNEQTLPRATQMVLFDDEGMNPLARSEPSIRRATEDATDECKMQRSAKFSHKCFAYIQEVTCRMHHGWVRAFKHSGIFQIVHRRTQECGDARR